MNSLESLSAPSCAAKASSFVILVVDDDPLIAMSTLDMLEDIGHRGLEANSGRQALEILSSDQSIDLLVTDQAMPGMSGVELVKQARALRPGLPVLLVTGYGDLPNGDGASLPRLGKPYQRAQLETKIAGLLSQNP